MKTLNFLHLFLILIIILPVVCAEQNLNELPLQKISTCIDLTKTCTNCSYINVTSIKYPNGTLLTLNKEMTQVAPGIFKYNFCLSADSGINTATYFGDDEASKGSFYFKTTPSGQEMTGGISATYIFFLLICITLIYLSVKLIKEHSMKEDKLDGNKLYEIKKRNEFVFYMELVKKKLWIAGAFGIYLSSFIFLAVLNQLVYDLGISGLNSLLKDIVYVLAWGLIPFTLFWVVWLIIYFVKSTAEIMKHQLGGFIRQ